MIKQALIAKEVAHVIVHSSAFKHWLMLVPIKTFATHVIAGTAKSYLLTKAHQLKYDLNTWKSKHPHSINILTDANTLYVALVILDAADVLIQ